MNEHRSPITPAVLVRPAGPADRDALQRLAVLDSKRALGDDVVLAEHGGRIVAALDLTDGRVVADPFAPTAADVRLLRAHTTPTTRSHRPSLHLRRLAA